MNESRDLGVTRPSENQQCHGNNAWIAPSSHNTNTVGTADRDARKLEYSMRSSEYNAKNIIQTTSDHIKDVTSGSDTIPINMTARKYQPTPTYMKCDRPDNTLFMEKNDSNNTTKHRKLHENVLNSDDSHIGKSSKIAKCAAVSADTFSDKMGSRSSHGFGSSFPSNEYNGYSIDGSHDDETVAHIESSPSNSPEPFTKIHNWNIPLGNSWGSFEFSHGTLSGVLSDILTEKSGMFSDHKTPIVYSTTGRKSRSSSFNGTGGGLFHTKKRNSTNTKKFESSIKSSSMELYSNEMTNESIVLDYRKYAEKKRFRGEADDECVGTENDDTNNLTLGTRTNEIQPASLYSNNNTVVVINNNNNNNNNNSNNKNNKNNPGKQTVQGYKHEKNNRINDTIHLDIITNKHDDRSNMKNDFYVFNQIGNSGSFSTEKRYDNYDLYLRSCFEGNEECSDSNTRRVLKSHTKLDNMKKNSPNFRLRLVRTCVRFCSTRL